MRRTALLASFTLRRVTAWIEIGLRAIKFVVDSAALQAARQPEMIDGSEPSAPCAHLTGQHLRRRE